MNDNNKEDFDPQKIVDSKNENTSDEALDTSEASPDGINPTDARPKKKYKRSDIIRLVILFVAIGVFIFAAINLIHIITQNNKQEKYLDEQKQHTISVETIAPIKGKENETTSQTPYRINRTEIPDYQYFQKINDSYVGHVYVPQCGIFLPVAQSSDNDYYLTHNFNNEEFFGGSAFLDCQNNSQLSDGHAFIYGHNMKNGTIFASLLDYQNEDFYKKMEAENKNYFYIYQDGICKVYKIFMVTDVTYADNPEAYRIIKDGIKYDGKEYSVTDYYNYIKTLQLYDTGITVTDSDKILTLYTCENDADRVVRHLVHAKLVAEETI